MKYGQLYWAPNFFEVGKCDLAHKNWLKLQKNPDSTIKQSTIRFNAI